MTESIVDLYIKKGLASRNAARYYAIRGNKKVFLGMGKQQADSRLLELIQDNSIADLRSPAASSPVQPGNDLQVDDNTETPYPEPGPGNPEKVIEETSEEASDTEPDDDDTISALASMVTDISIRSAGNGLNVYWKGVDVRLTDHSVIKNSPFVFYWALKKEMVRSGEVSKSGGWTVFPKSLNRDRAGNPLVTVERDDAPNDDFFCHEEHILVYADRKQFVAHKNRKVAKNTMRSHVREQREREASIKASRMSEDTGHDIRDSFRHYQSGNSESSKIGKEHLTMNQGMSPDEAEDILSRMDDPVKQREFIENMSVNVGGNIRNSRKVRMT